MDKFYFAYASSGQTSGQLKSQSEAELWGRNFLHSNSKTNQVFILQAVGAVEREQTPIKFTPVKDEPQLLSDGKPM